MPVGRFAGRWCAGRVIDVGDDHIHGLSPAKGGQHGGDQRSQFWRWDAPPGADLDLYPSVTDRNAGDCSAGQVRDDLTEPATVQPGHSRACLNRRGDSVDVDAVDEGWPWHAADGCIAHDTRDGVASWPSSPGR
jgi:hypothetical protein